MPEDFHAVRFIKVGLFYKQKRLVLCVSFVVADSQSNKDIQVAIAAVFHLFPFRTEKLSPPTPMVLPTKWESR